MRTTLAETRKILEENKNVEEHYYAMIDAANDYLKSNTQVCDELDERVLGICDYYKSKPKFKDKTDEEILKYYEMLEEKYEDVL